MFNIGRIHAGRRVASHIDVPTHAVKAVPLSVQTSLRPNASSAGSDAQNLRGQAALVSLVAQSRQFIRAATAARSTHGKPNKAGRCA